LSLSAYADCAVEMGGSSVRQAGSSDFIDTTFISTLHQSHNSLMYDGRIPHADLRRMKLVPARHIANASTGLISFRNYPQLPSKASLGVLCLQDVENGQIGSEQWGGVLLGQRLSHF